MMMLSLKKKIGNVSFIEISKIQHIVKKTEIVVWDQVGHKPGCTATKDD